MMNKKGEDLEENTLGIVLAIMVSLLIFAGIILGYYKWVENSEAENAKRILGEIKTSIDNLGENVSGNITLEGFKTKNHWKILGWSKTDSNKPDKCFFSTCVCVCNVNNNFIEDCQNHGFCRDVDSDSLEVTSTEILVKDNNRIGGDPTISAGRVGAQDETIKSESPLPYVDIPEVLFKLSITKTSEDDKIKIVIKKEA